MPTRREKSEIGASQSIIKEEPMNIKHKFFRLHLLTIETRLKISKRNWNIIKMDSLARDPVEAITPHQWAASPWTFVIIQIIIEFLVLLASHEIFKNCFNQEIVAVFVIMEWNARPLRYPAFFLSFWVKMKFYDTSINEMVRLVRAWIMDTQTVLNAYAHKLSISKHLARKTNTFQWIWTRVNAF